MTIQVEVLQTVSTSFVDDPVDFATPGNPELLQVVLSADGRTMEVTGMREGETTLLLSGPGGEATEEVIVEASSVVAQFEVYYRLARTRPAAPATTDWGVAPASWSATRPDATTANAVWAATRLRPAAAADASEFAVSLEQARLPVVLPLTASATVLWGNDGAGWFTTGTVSPSGGQAPYRVFWIIEGDEIAAAPIGEGASFRTWPVASSVGDVRTLHYVVRDAGGNALVGSAASGARPA